MAKEKDTTLAALQTGIQMEIDGKEFYLNSSKASKNDLGKQLLTRLAAEEDIHRKVFEGIYQKISSQQGWPAVKISNEGVKGLQTLFAEATKTMSKGAKSIPTELDAVNTAMDMENKTYDFYKERSGKASYAAEKKLYEEIAAQEKEHHRLLLDYFEFLKNPAAWYVQKEHTSVDGG